MDSFFGLRAIVIAESALVAVAANLFAGTDAVETVGVGLAALIARAAVASLITRENEL